jgi:hypothetical protein
MFKQVKKTAPSPEEEFAPEKLSYSKYYEHDGALRAYANRSMVLACAMTLLAFGSLGFAAYVRLQPPTVIRIAPDGESAVVSGRSVFRAKPAGLTEVNATQAPQGYEKEAFVRQFLDHYLNYDLHNVTLQWATALNMMTGNLKSSALRIMQKEDAVGKIEDEKTRSVFHLRGVEMSKDDPMAYLAYGVREIHRFDDGHHETIEQTVNQYTIRLADLDRSADNPSGLLISQYGEKQIDGEKKAALLAADTDGWKSFMSQQPGWSQ